MGGLFTTFGNSRSPDLRIVIVSLCVLLSGTWLLPDAVDPGGSRSVDSSRHEGYCADSIKAALSQCRGSEAG